MSLEWISRNQINELNDLEKEWLKDWWQPEPGNRYYNENYSFACVVPDCAELSDYKGKYVPILSVGQMLRIVNPITRPKFFKVTKNAQRYYRNRHNPSVKLRVGEWAFFCRMAHKNAWQHKVFSDQSMVQALWKLTKYVLSIKAVR